ncbi:MAG: hypothetical protein LBH49_00385 [Puniceicoccales bacterium]|jgi:hypothetical protein|nr:hypothetical protein [Puniceicoccales bacterium]
MSEINRINLSQMIRNLGNAAVKGSGKEVKQSIRFKTNEGETKKASMVTISATQSSRIAAFFNRRFGTTFGVKYSFVGLDNRKCESLTANQLKNEFKNEVNNFKQDLKTENQ